MKINIETAIAKVSAIEDAIICIESRQHGKSTSSKFRMEYKIEIHSDDRLWSGYWWAEGDWNDSLSKALSSAVRNLIKIIRKEKLHSFEQKLHIEELKTLVAEI